MPREPGAARVDAARRCVHPARMNAFETTAVMEDASHLALRQPVPQPARKECRVIVLFEPENGGAAAWPDGFFDSIRVEDAAFARPPQGSAPHIAPLDS